MRRENVRLYVNRVRNFLNRLKRDEALAASIPLTAEVMVTDTPVPFNERLADRDAYDPIGKGDIWGREWQSAWFHISGTVPLEWRGQHVAARLNMNSEACLFDDEGCPLYGLTSQSVFAAHYGKDLVRLFEPCEGGEPVDLWLEAAANQLFGIDRQPHAERMAPTRHGTYTGRVRHLELCILDLDVWHLLLDMEVLFDLYEALPDNTPRRNQLLDTLNQAVAAYADSRDNAANARAVLAPLFALPPNPADLSVVAVGHAHIDTGWLWPVRETIRKSARTFSSQIALLERYPEYVFGASQPQHYAFVKTHYPKLYEKIKGAVTEGRWELQGGMWVEADCNIISGESMVRQFLHGKNFFMEAFGIDVKNVWIPDVFGYSAAMPQIFRKAGAEVFLTQKISWNFTNEFPHNTFMWEGIDGSRILTHFPPENTYNSNLLPKPLNDAQKRFRENSYITEFMSLFGIGNGGGGPKEEHVERGRRLKALNGAPTVTFGTAQSFFEKLQPHARQLPTWVGELYLELHRATLTTQAQTKRGNRKLELKLRETEFVCAMLPLNEYPRETLDYVWKKLLINQFHDILPGSSIHAVYEQTLSEYEEGMALCDGLIREAAARILKADRDCLTLFNSLSCPYTAPIQLPADWHGCSILDEAGRPIPVQVGSEASFVRVDVPPLGFLTLRKGPGKVPQNPALKTLVLENSEVRYEFATDATLVRATEKGTGREWIPEGSRGNQFSLYVDRPQNWDAWDIDITYEDELLEHARPVASVPLDSGPVQARLRFDLAVGQSRITQVVTLPENGKRLDFRTQVDWRESHRMLRVAFPTPVQTPEATCDIQYGYLKRPTHRNTSWDLAKFEVAAHKYVDMTDNDGGVALLNDCKYGHKVYGNTLDLNLLRAPTEPDPDADYGHHSFTYSLLPHTEPFLESSVMHEASMLNQPPVGIEGYTAGTAELPLTVEGDGIALAVLKKAEKEDCLVVRIVETKGRHSSGSIKLRDGAATLVQTNLMEWTTEEELPCKHETAIELAPFEIRTYKIVR